MATATRTRSKRKNTHLGQVCISYPADNALPGQIVNLPTHACRDPEPLEVGERSQEAPESRQSHQQEEAPDAGCKYEFWPHEVMHRGRSRS